MSKEQRSQECQGGKAYARSARKDNFFKSIVRGFSDAIVSPKKSSGDDYERGWREEVKDEKKK
jgi:hypothetical protein